MELGSPPVAHVCSGVRRLDFALLIDTFLIVLAISLFIKGFMIKGFMANALMPAALAESALTR
jgi:hypothetical protein